MRHPDAGNADEDVRVPGTYLNETRIRVSRFALNADEGRPRSRHLLE